MNWNSWLHGPTRTGTRHTDRQFVVRDRFLMGLDRPLRKQVMLNVKEGDTIQSLLQTAKRVDSLAGRRRRSRRAGGRAVPKDRRVARPAERTIISGETACTTGEGGQVGANTTVPMAVGEHRYSWTISLHQEGE